MLLEESRVSNAMWKHGGKRVEREEGLFIVHKGTYVAYCSESNFSKFDLSPTDPVLLFPSGLISLCSSQDPCGGEHMRVTEHKYV